LAITSPNAQLPIDPIARRNTMILEAPTTAAANPVKEIQLDLKVKFKIELDLIHSCYSRDFR
jgi:hypothetical protein